LIIKQVDFVTEYRYCEARKFRFDFAIVDKKIAIEYEGINSEFSRHTEMVGYTRDCTKYNIAASLGWRVLRYTALNYKDFENDLKAMI